MSAKAIFLGKSYYIRYIEWEGIAMTSLWMSNRMLRVALLAVTSSWVAVTTAQSQTAIDREIIEARKTYGSCLQQWISSMASSPDSAEEIVNTAYRNCRTFNAALCSLNEKKYNK